MKTRFTATKTVISIIIAIASIPHVVPGETADKVCVQLPGIKLDRSKELDEIPMVIPKSRITCVTPKDEIGSESQMWNSGNAAAMQIRMNSKFTISQQKVILDMHNEYRAMVQPPAGDMNFMEWHEDAAMLAQKYAEHCIFEHGFPPNHPLSKKLGQNLYMGPDMSGQRAVKLWFEERKDFDIHTLHCAAEMCGHYTQVVWANSKFVGCGVTTCSKNQHLIVCHYFPAGNYVGEAPYKIGYPCSNCGNIQNGALCSKKACVSPDQCNRLKLSNCSCDLHCHNCGRLDESKCRCQCLPGWDQLDCSVPCMDAHEKCGKNPGFPSPQMCWSNEMIRSSFCRKMCQQCTPAGPKNDPSKLCCAGIICRVDQVLDQHCQCVSKCNGNVCFGGTNKGQVHRSGMQPIFLLLLLTFTFAIQCCLENCCFHNNRKF